MHHFACLALQHTILWPTKLVEQESK